jgi:beta-glucosidase
MSFRDARLPLADRIADLLSQLSLAEKVALLHQHQAPVPRLGIADFRTGTEALHGLAWLGPATVFPQAVGLASSWNTDLMRRVGDAVGDETRGFYHKDPTRGGLNVWAPVVNLLRDPRWGRNEEGYAEDPLLTGALATAYAQGLRGDHERYLKTAPTLKHFLAYNNETRRDTSNSSMPARVLHEYELPAFRAPIEAGAAMAVMASYNLVNGRPAHLSPLINDELRSWSDDDILLVSDAQAPSNVVNPQRYHRDHAESHAALIRAGVDSFTDNNEDTLTTVRRVTEALDRGLLTESDVDTAIGHALAIRFRLGEFDDPAGNPYTELTEEVINCPAHQALAAEAARQSVVLLKNDGILPLPADPGVVAVVGPLADTLYEDWYSGTLPYGYTVRGGLTERLGAERVRYAEGLDRVALRVVGAGYLAMSPTGGPVPANRVGAGEPALVDVEEWGQGVLALRAVVNGRYLTVGADGTLANEAPRPGGWEVRETFSASPREGGVALKHLATGQFLTLGPDGLLRAESGEPAVFDLEPVRDGVAEAVAAAQGADVVVVVVGNQPMINGRETEDRADLALPPTQDRLIRAVAAVNPRTVLIMTSSYPYAVDWAQDHLPALLWSAHGGQESGRALAEVLLGDAAPAGRLTQTWYASDTDLPDLLDYDIISTDSTYLYYRGTPLYPFGHGLTYSPVRYHDLRLSAPEVAADGAVEVRVSVTNDGDRATDEVVQLYTRQQRSRVKQPLRQLRGFQRVSLAPGERREVTFRLAAADLATWDVTRSRFVVEDSDHLVRVGASSADLRLGAVLAVRGETIPPRDLSGGVNAADFDDYGAVVLVDADPVRGDAVRATGPGAWVCFREVDFTGATALRVSVAHLLAGPVGVVARLDDPLDGEALGGVEVESDGSGYHFVEGSTPVAVTGVHDLFLILPAAGVSVRDLRLAAADGSDGSGGTDRR